VEKSGLSSIVETQEQELRVLVKKSKGGQHIVDYPQHVSAHPNPNRLQAAHRGEHIHQLTIHMMQMY
jgi:hypothetical protein